MKKVIVYSTPTCHFCHLAMDFLTEHNIPFTEYDVAADTSKRKEMVDKSDQLGVPVIDVDGQILIGFNEEVLARALGI